MILRIIYLIKFCCLVKLFLSCSSSSKKSFSSKDVVLKDSIFYKILNSAKNLSFPIQFDKSINRDDLIYLMRMDSSQGADSSFIVRYLCEYDNFCFYKSRGNGIEYKLLGYKYLNDSVLFVIYQVSDDTDESKVFTYETSRYELATFNILKSRKPIDKLVLQGYKEGKYELNSYIDTNFIVSSNHYLSLHSLTKDPRNGPNLPPAPYNEKTLISIVFNQYKILSNGEVYKTQHFEGLKRATQFKGKHFEVENSDTVLLLKSWERKTNGNIQYTSKYEDRVIFMKNKLFITDTSYRNKKFIFDLDD